MSGGPCKIVEKYTEQTWQRTRLSFLRKGDIFRARDPYAQDEWHVYVALSDPSTDDGTIGMQVMPYKLTTQYTFTDDMTHVVLEKPNDTNDTNDV